MKERKKRWKRGEEEKREEEQGERKGKRENEMGKKRRKKRRENEREGEGEERRGRERRENRESDTRNVPPSQDAFLSTKLGNNTTPIKGRLRKNTTPTSRGLIELNQNPQADPLQRRPSFDAPFRAYSSCTPERAEDSEYGLHSNRAVIYKKVKALRNLPNCFRFSMNPH